MFVKFSCILLVIAASHFSCFSMNDNSTSPWFPEKAKYFDSRICPIQNIKNDTFKVGQIQLKNQQSYPITFDQGPRPPKDKYVDYQLNTHNEHQHFHKKDMRHEQRKPGQK